MNIETRRIVDIIVGPRHRKDMGDLGGLAASIRSVGLLQPIGVTPENMLVFGERRMRACRKLERTEIPVVVVHIDKILDGEYAENEVRKDFTASERLDIADAVEAAMRGRAGNPSLKPIVHHGAQLETGEKTREIAARKAGFVSHGAMQRAKTVDTKGEPGLMELVDAEKVKVSPAADVASLPPERQRKILSAADPVKEIQMASKEVRERKARKLHVRADGPSVGREIVEGLTEMRDDLRDGKRPRRQAEKVAALGVAIKPRTLVAGRAVSFPPWPTPHLPPP